MGRNLHDSSLAGTVTAKAGANATNDDKGELKLRRAETPRPPLQHLRSLGRLLPTHRFTKLLTLFLQCIALSNFSRQFLPRANSTELIHDIPTLLPRYSSMPQRFTLRPGSTCITATATFDDVHHCDGEIDDFG